MRVALVHDWLTAHGGAEKVLESIWQVFPSKIFTLLYDPIKFENTWISDVDIETSFIQRLPYAKRWYRKYAPLFPLAIEQLDVSDYELVISSSHAVAKGVLTHSDQIHICYCHTPMRYVWDLYHQYLKDNRLEYGIKGGCAKWMLHYLRMWDASSAMRVDRYVANSKYVAKRIKKLYGKVSDVIYPPVDTDYFSLYEDKEDFYLVVSRMVPYKKVGLIVEAFNVMADKRLVVIGEGPSLPSIRKQAGVNIEILGYQDNDKLRFYLQRAKCFVNAALEDFGILPVEAQACGTPVIALGHGGTQETVVDGVTGVLFDRQIVGDIIKAVEHFEKLVFSSEQIHNHAQQFSKHAFEHQFEQLAGRVVKEFTL